LSRSIRYSAASPRRGSFDRRSTATDCFEEHPELNGDCLPLPKPPIRLTARQKQVLQWAAAGKTDWETAAILGISEKAVKFHILAARERLNATNRTHAVAKAILLGLIGPL
jgi:DNA-binding CsgD family transcriptional regulator